MNTQQPRSPESPTPPEVASSHVSEQVRRAGVYSLIAALLRDYPGDEVLAYAAELDADASANKTDLAVAFSMLSLAARHSEPASLRDEYHALFIGLGRGELVPYGSWYQTGFLMEKPLGQLRADLARLGFERSDEVHEPEDHIAALCEVMALLISDEVPIETQRLFFESHIGNWAGAFFDDLEQADNAVFYKSVARLGSAFFAVESDYLALFD